MKWILAASSLMLVALNVNSGQQFESRYARVESYEIRPGVLAMPKYAKDGTLCQVSIEKLRVQPDAVDLGASTMPRNLVLEMVDELAPPSERGSATVQLAGFDYIDIIDGSVDIATANYRNVSVQIYKTTSVPGDMAAVLQWNREACGTSSDVSAVKH